MPKLPKDIVQLKHLMNKHKGISHNEWEHSKQTLPAQQTIANMQITVSLQTQLSFPKRTHTNRKNFMKNMNTYRSIRKDWAAFKKKSQHMLQQKWDITKVGKRNFVQYKNSFFTMEENKEGDTKVTYLNFFRQNKYKFKKPPNAQKADRKCMEDANAV